MKILIAYYPLYGHIHRLAGEAAAAVDEVPGIQAVLRRVPEFDVVEKAIGQNDYMRQLRDAQKDVPVVTLENGLWMQGALEGKPAGVFTSTASTHGGQETTLLTMMVPLLHLGTLIVGIPYSTEGLAHTEARGASPYGASTLAGGRGELPPAEQDLFFIGVQAKKGGTTSIENSWLVRFDPEHSCYDPSLSIDW